MLFHFCGQVFKLVWSFYNESNFLIVHFFYLQGWSRCHILWYNDHNNKSIVYSESGIIDLDQSEVIHNVHWEKKLSAWVFLADASCMCKGRVKKKAKTNCKDIRRSRVWVRSDHWDSIPAGSGGHSGRSLDAGTCGGSRCLRYCYLEMPGKQITAVNQPLFSLSIHLSASCLWDSPVDLYWS